MPSTPSSAVSSRRRCRTTPPSFAGQFTIQRSGFRTTVWGMMSTIHAARLSLVLSLLEVTWFATSDKKNELETFIAFIKNVRGIILNPSQSPRKSVLGRVSVPFHQPLLQILFFCVRNARSMA